MLTASTIQAQLQASADWGVQLSFLAAGRYLWLNYHTVHHLFPITDFSHHPAIQKILMEVRAKQDLASSPLLPLVPLLRRDWFLRPPPPSSACLLRRLAAVGQTVKEFKIKYTTGDPLTIYMQMLWSFATPLSLMQEIVVYAGGL